MCRARLFGRPRPRGAGGYSIEQAISDRAQLNTIAFDGLAFLTGDRCSNTFIPPGKVSDFFGFQYMRDIDSSEGGHNTSFLTRIANATLAVLTDAQKAQLIELARAQERPIEEFAHLRFPLIMAFTRQLTGDVPSGTVLSRDAVMRYSADLCERDGTLAYDRARVVSLSRRYGELDGELSYTYATRFAEVARTLDPAQKQRLYQAFNREAYPGRIIRSVRETVSGYHAVFRNASPSLRPRS